MEIARLKQVDAVLCQVISKRISDRVMAYWGFQPHHPGGRGRHYIRRFYGEYPAYTDWIESLPPTEPVIGGPGESPGLPAHPIRDTED